MSISGYLMFVINVKVMLIQIHLQKDIVTGKGWSYGKNSEASIYLA